MTHLSRAATVTAQRKFRSKRDKGDSVGRSHEVVLLGKKFKLRSTHDDDYLAALAAFVTAQVGEVQRRGGAVSTLDAALLAALNIADEYHRLKREAEERLAAIGEKTQALLTALDEDSESRGERAAAPDEVVVEDPPEDAVADESGEAVLAKADAGRR